MPLWDVHDVDKPPDREPYAPPRPLLPHRAHITNVATQPDSLLPLHSFAER